MTEPQPEHQAALTQGPDGTFVASPQTAERDAEAARLRGRGLGYREIAAALGVSVATAHEAVQRALRAIRAEGAADVRELELQRLDDMYAAVMKVLETRHVTVSQGRVIYVGEEPLLDDAPVLAAVDRLLKIQARRAALLGLDAEQKVSVSGGVKYEIIGIPAEDL